MANTASVCKQTEMDWTYDTESMQKYRVHTCIILLEQTFGRQSRKLNTLNHQMVHLQKLWHFLKINKLGWKVNNKDCIFFFNLSNLNLLMRNLISGCWNIWWCVTWPHLNKKSKERRGPWCSEVLTLLGYINWGEWLSLIFEWNLIYCTLFCYALCY